MGLSLLALLVASLPVGVEAMPDKDDDEVEQAYDRLLARPIDVNRATVDDLLLLPWLEPVLAYRIIIFRDSVGRFADIGQLRDVPGIDEQRLTELRRVLVVPRGRPEWSADIAARSSTDSVPGWGSRTRSLATVQVRRAGWELRAVAEQDRGEASLADWLGVGLGYSGAVWRLVLGDYYASTGLGLVLSGPQRRGVLAAGRDAGSGPVLRLAGTSLENRGLRGGGVEWQRGGWQAIGFGAVSPRDAELDSFGNVARLVSSGVHRDSASRARRHRLTEAAAGFAVSGSRRPVRVSLVAAGVRYSRPFSSADTAGSFSGQALGNCGLVLDWLTGDYRLAAELGVSSSARLAGGVELAGDWRGLSVRCAARATQQDYFAPLSSSRSLTGRKAKAEVSGRIGYGVSGFRVGLSGRTYRDFAEDSLPARVEARAGYQAGRFGVELGVGQSYRLEQRRSRTGRFEFRYRPASNAELAAVLADEYPANDTGSGRVAALLAKLEPGRFSGSLTCARCIVRGSGVALNLREYGGVSSGLDFSTGRSCWYGSVGVSYRLRRGTGFGLRVARVEGSERYWQAGMQLEMGVN